MIPLPPASTIGILGGGQLGRLLAIEAARLGFEVAVFTPNPRDPALKVCARPIVAGWDNDQALMELGLACDAVTLEFENVPVPALETIEASGAPVLPGLFALTISQDRVIEKTFLNDLGIQTVAWRKVGSRADLDAGLRDLGGAGILKRTRDGYDGKGQARIRTPEDAGPAWDALEGKPCVLEAFAPFQCEISAIVARSTRGELAAWDCPRNDHEGGILSRSTVPSGLDAKIEVQAVEQAKALAEALDYFGVLALEYFVMPDGTLLANEFAPRVHNSGHWTPEAAYTCQFEQHIRAVAGWPLGETGRHSHAVMENLIGAQIFGAFDRLSNTTRLTHYAKQEARPGRKMGHLVTRSPRR